MDPYRIKRILNKLERIWEAQPNAHLGQVLEKLDTVAWDLVLKRDVSTRFLNMPDECLENGLNKMINDANLGSNWKS
jgi:hypothetical protein